MIKKERKKFLRLSLSCFVGNQNSIQRFSGFSWKLFIIFQLYLEDFTDVSEAIRLGFSASFTSLDAQWRCHDSNSLYNFPCEISYIPRTSVRLQWCGNFNQILVNSNVSHETSFLISRNSANTKTFKLCDFHGCLTTETRFIARKITLYLF